MILERPNLPPTPRILVVALRRLGDVLLTTPLIRSIRSAWPDGRIDVLVFADTAAILAGNPDIDRIVTMPVRPTAAQTLVIGARVIGRYDLSVSTQSGDRPCLFALIASAKAVAPVERRLSGRLKSAMLWRAVPHDPQAHRVEALLRLADALCVPRALDVVPPKGECRLERPIGPYVIIHAAPMFNYKRWTVAGWRALLDALVARGVMVLATGGPSEAERRYLDEVWGNTSAVRLDGKCDWQELTELMAAARVFVGPDTSVTHLAAAVGCPTVALFGPTDPRLWGPWPPGGLAEAWAAQKPLQRRANIWIVQHAFPCTPCQLEGCERALASGSECLRQLTPTEVLSAIDQALNSISNYCLEPETQPSL
jgi:heptosyltransferase-3